MPRNVRALTFDLDDTLWPVAPVIDRGPYASSDYVFDFSAALSCNVFKPAGIKNSCFTRHDVRWQVVGKVNLKQYLASH